MKNTVKHLFHMLSSMVVLPGYGLYLLLSLIAGKDSVFWGFSQFFSLLPGKAGSFLRNGFYRYTMTTCHRNCAILFGTIFSQVDTEIGKGVYIGPNCNIGKSRIEDHCTLGSNVHVLSGKNQHFFDDPAIPVQEQGGVFKKIVIGEDTWIGNCAVIMANIGKKCIVGAGSVVTRDVPDYSIVAGNPARVIKQRSKRP